MQLILSKENALSCCSCQRYAESLAAASPFLRLDDLLAEARRIWWNQVSVAGWLEAFAAHPKIGDLEGLKKKFGAFADMSRGEQSAASASATDEVLQELALWNKKYEEKFGHIFIICASGKSAQEMLAAVKARYLNAPFSELGIASGEQMKITELRLRKLFESGDGSGALPSGANKGVTQVERRTGTLRNHLGASPPSPSRSPITTHVLDTCLGRPAQGVPITLERKKEGTQDEWEVVAQSATNKDGRIPDLLPPSNYIQSGIYRITFDTTTYMAACKTLHPTFFADVPFYPQAVVYFHITPAQVREHFHVPLTWNPYGYSTYRGS